MNNERINEMNDMRLDEREMKEMEKDIEETEKAANRNVRSWIKDARRILGSEEFSPRLKECAQRLLDSAIVVDRMQNNCACNSEIEAAGGVPGVFVNLIHALDEARDIIEEEDVYL